MATQILCIAGPTASGKSTRAVEEALSRGGEVISVDSRQVYCGLDIGTEKITVEEMCGVPHHLIDIREPKETYSAGDFVVDASRLIDEISARDKLPILVGGTHFYFDALLNGLPENIQPDATLRTKLDLLTNNELFSRIENADPGRAAVLDQKNRRRLIRALEIISARGYVPKRKPLDIYSIEWLLLGLESRSLRTHIDDRLRNAFARGLIEEVHNIRECVGDTRLNELGLEYRLIGEYLQHTRDETALMPALSAKLWQYARRQKAWLRKLQNETIVAELSHLSKN